MVAWKTCTRLKEFGGLGITDLKLAATAFEAKWMWLQKNDHERAWAALPLRLTDEARAFFRASTYTVIGNGRNTLFWLDSWINGVSIRAIAPTLLSFVSKRAINRQTVAQALPGRNWVHQIRGGMSVHAMGEYLQLWRAVRDMVLTDAPDQLIWRWASDGKFSVRSAYLALHLGSHSVAGCTGIWDSWAPLRIKLFLWFAIRRRHWTAERRRRHGLDARDDCWLCDQEPESIDHIVVGCSFSRQIWFTASAALGTQLQQPPSGTIAEWWDTWRSQWTGTYMMGADTLFALIAWEIWKERNGRCFRGANTKVQALMAIIRFNAEQWVQAGAKHLGCLLQRVIG
jgi:hypothetical protein